jgi:hypothetical protein
MGFLDYIKKMMDQEVNTTNLMTGEPDRRTVGQRLRAGGEWVPGPSDVISGYDAWEALKKGNYGEAALNAVGTLPLVPALGGVIRKSSESIVPKYAYDSWNNQTNSRNEELVQNAINTLHQKWAKSAGSETDPFYKLIEEGKINAENMDDVFGGANEIGDLIRDRGDFAAKLDTLGGYSGQYDRLPHWTRQLADWRENVDLPPMEGVGDAKMIGDLYDAFLLAPPMRGNGDLGKFAGKGDLLYKFPDYAEALSDKEKAFFDKLGDYDPVGLDLYKSEVPMFENKGEPALLHALNKGRITPSSLADNRISLSGLIDFIQQHQDDVLQEGAKVPPEDVVHTFESGHRWEELKNPEQLGFEGKKMSNCVGGYCSKVEKGESRIFSLRNPEGTPKITAEWDPRTRSFNQIYGPGNSMPKDKYRDMIDKLIEMSIDW